MAKKPKKKTSSIKPIININPIPVAPAIITSTTHKLAPGPWTVITNTNGTYATSATVSISPPIPIPPQKLAKIEQKVKFVQYGVDRLISIYLSNSQPNSDMNRDNLIQDLNVNVMEMQSLIDSCYVFNEYTQENANEMCRLMKRANSSWKALKKLGISHSSNWFK